MYGPPQKKYLGHQEDPSTVFSSLFNLSFKCRLHNTRTTFIGIKTRFAAFSVDLFTFVTYGDSRFKYKKCLLKRSKLGKRSRKGLGEPQIPCLLLICLRTEIFVDNNSLRWLLNLLRLRGYSLVMLLNVVFNINSLFSRKVLEDYWYFYFQHN